MNVPPSIALFMIVTRRDLCIARHSIPSYDAIAARHPGLTLVIYANGLTQTQKDACFPAWAARRHVRIIDNTAAPGSCLPKAGDVLTTPLGHAITLDDGCKHHDEVWTRELPRLEADFVGTCDADFEVLDAGFFDEMVRRLEQDPKLAAVSTDYSATKEGHWESYSGREITLHERWHTWCCLYRREALCAGHQHHFHSTTEDGVMHCYDSAAWMQERLIEAGWHMEHLPDEYQGDFIHYGAFSKNLSLQDCSVGRFRCLAIGRKVGLRRLSRAKNPFIAGVNRLVKRASGRIFHALYAGAQEERTRLVPAGHERDSDA